jgi:Holliday junction resolvase-like predicted endonuclease
VISNKRRGSQFESKTKKLLEDKNHVVIKTAVSDANPDIMSYYNNTINLIEVKSISTNKYEELRRRLHKQMKSYYILAEALSQTMTNNNIQIGLIVWFKQKNRWKNVIIIDDYKSYDKTIDQVFDNILKQSNADVNSLS